MRFREDLSRIDWPVALFIVGYHATLAVGLPLYFVYAAPSAGIVAASLGLLFFTSIGIGAAYHRYYAHRCYDLARPVETVLLFLATLAFQGSALRWAHDHRRHHAYVDTDEDPYSIRRGFFYAHVGWLFFKLDPIEPGRVKDLLRNPLVTFQHRWAGSLGLAANALVSAFLGWATGDWIGAFVIAWWTRLLVSHHLTWFINSLAHTWGSRTFSREHSAVDNWMLALLTVGEGYHNYHHTFASDYRNGVRWYHFDPTKWTIWSLGRLGLARNLKRYSRPTIERRLIEEDRRLLLGALARQTHRTRVEIEGRVHHLADALQQTLRHVAETTEEIERLDRHPGVREGRRVLRERLRALRRQARQDTRAWSRLCRSVLSLEPSPAGA